MPIGPHCAIADVDAIEPGDGVRAGAGAQRPPGEPRRRHRRVTGVTLPAQNCRVDLVRGRELVRRRPDGRGQRGGRRSSRRSSASRCACSGCAGTSTAGTTAGVAQHVRRQDGRRRERQDRRRRLDDLRPGAEQHRHDEGAARASAHRGRRLRAAAVSLRRTRPSTRTRHRRRVLAKTQPLYGGCVQAATSSGPRMHRSSTSRASRSSTSSRTRSNMDPIAFRRLNIDGDDRRPARAGWRCSTARRMAAGWKPKVAASNLADRRTSATGRGFGFGTFAAQPGRHRRGRRGEHEDRQDRRQAPVHRPEQRRSRSARSSSRTR